ncbi:TetR/AcrR family transcriptional regulator [Cryobacterium glaciale]|uniref:TetR/AcrR family transcriptional regulator n=1 Tax=Cryobacterium glaciale TaxID=1259145 RepID=A0A4R8V5R0_9MICO|nr:TetR/AcrR family transcriptional regulator [Cryobacterium glaciale]TFB77294.1 TetR/AcrR family transcriptional regulator [Cryobacterium glaciale]
MVKALSTPGSEHQSNRRNRDVEVMDAAIKVFSQKGYSAASLQDIADEVGLLKGSLYHYINSKESLLFRVLQDTHHHAEIMMQEVNALNLPAQERLLVYVERLATWYLANLERASLYLTEWRYLQGEHAAITKTQRRAYDEYMRSILIEAQETGFIRTDMDIRVATSFIISAIGSIPTWYRTSRPVNPAHIASELSLLACSSVFGKMPPLTSA